MALTITPYNHTARRFADGSFTPGDTYKVMLLTTATFDASDAILADIAYSEIAGSYGYTSGGVALTSVDVTTVTTNDAKFDADDSVWTASGGNIAANYAIMYNETVTDSPPLVFIDFDGTETAVDGTDFMLVWNANGIFSWTVA